MVRGDLPALESVQGLLHDFFDGKSEAPIGTVLEAKKFSQSKDYDIRVIISQFPVRFIRA